MKTNRTILLLLVLSTLVRGLAVSGNNPKKAVAVRTPVAPRIDGVLDEPEWKLATPITDFTQQDPNEGAPGSQPTDIRLLYR